MGSNDPWWSACVCVLEIDKLRERERERVVHKVDDKHSFSALIVRAVGTSCQRHTHRAANTQNQPPHTHIQPKRPLSTHIGKSPINSFCNCTYNILILIQCSTPNCSIHYNYINMSIPWFSVVFACVFIPCRLPDTTLSHFTFPPCSIFSFFLSLFVIIQFFSVLFFRFAFLLHLVNSSFAFQALL